MAIRRKLLGGCAALWGLTQSALTQASSMNLRPGVTETSQEAYELHMLVIVIMTVIAVIVFGAMFISILLHRKSKNPTPATFSHSTKLEIFWTAIPALILVGLSVPAVKLLIKMEDTSGADMSVIITGSQWKWHYKYPDYDIEFVSNLATPWETINQHKGANGELDENYLLEVDNEMVIPAGKKIRLLVTADDVIHSWWVPDLAVKKDAIPGFINETWTMTDKPGIYRGQCTELCGKNHGFMPVVVRVVEQQEFDAWVEEKKAEKLAAQKAAEEAAAKSWSLDDLMAQGEKAYATNCGTCHQVNGEGVPGAFPALKGSPIATGPVEKHIELVIHGPASKKMPGFAYLSDADLAAIITYERNAWGNNTGDVVQPADIKAYRAGN